ncbi:MAG TPA: hypothetical protein VN821_16585, partial [Candidatus Udaeobacter sp.]|nr:hypothetical protein [Candidatus Udaeobacter sp.]
ALSLFITTGATAFIAYFNYTLSRATIALQGAAEKQAKDTRTSLRIAVRAANAARRSADIADKSLLAANRPLLIIAPLELSHGDEIQPKPHVHFGLRNSGKGVSIVNRVGVTIQTSVPRALTLTQTTAFSDTSDFNGAIEPGETVVGNRVTSGVLTEETIMPIRRGELSLFFALEIVSQDIFHNPYTQKFPFIFDHVKGKFVRNRVFTEEKKKSE